MVVCGLGSYFVVINLFIFRRGFGGGMLFWFYIDLRVRRSRRMEYIGFGFGFGFGVSGFVWECFSVVFVRVL